MEDSVIKYCDNKGLIAKMGQCLQKRYLVLHFVIQDTFFAVYSSAKQY